MSLVRLNCGISSCVLLYVDNKSLSRIAYICRDSILIQFPLSHFPHFLHTRNNFTFSLQLLPVNYLTTHRPEGMKSGDGEGMLCPSNAGLYINKWKSS